MNQPESPRLPEKRLLLREGKGDAEKLKLFYEVAQPLARLLKELPPMRNPEAKFNVTLPKDDAAVPLPIEEVFRRAGETWMLLNFPHLPEPLFERLCLRFRPFYSEKEDTKFLGITAMLKVHNPDLRAEMDRYIDRWKRAVFWGRMDMIVPTAPGNLLAEDVIRVGFNSAYFHVTAAYRATARKYEEAVGRDMFRIALVSSVWERSFLVLELASALRPVLLAQGLATEDELVAFEREHEFSSQQSLTIESLRGRVEIAPYVPRNRSLTHLKDAGDS